ncbi:MAG: hypothetical protein JO254_12420, partial [Pseudolabrys sp.]|nr:hypothetical protein [Pseudolabrys sp.]
PVGPIGSAGPAGPSGPAGSVGQNGTPLRVLKGNATATCDQGETVIAAYCVSGNAAVSRPPEMTPLSAKCTGDASTTVVLTCARL